MPPSNKRRFLGAKKLISAPGAFSSKYGERLWFALPVFQAPRCALIFPLVPSLPKNKHYQREIKVRSKITTSYQARWLTFNSWFGYMWVWNTLSSTLADVLTRLTSLFFKKHYVFYVLLVLTCCPGRPCCPCSPGGPWAGKVSQRRHYINFHTLSYSNDFDFISGFLFFFHKFFPNYAVIFYKTHPLPKINT